MRRTGENGNDRGAAERSDAHRDARTEAMELIRFYEQHGWDWLDAAAFLLETARFGGPFHGPFPKSSP